MSSVLDPAGITVHRRVPDFELPAGVTAYQGAISLIMNETYLPIASGIEAVEVNPQMLLGSLVAVLGLRAAVQCCCPTREWPELSDNSAAL